MVAHLDHWRGIFDVQRDFDAAKGEAEEIATTVVTDCIERAFRIEGLGHIRFGVQDGLDTMGRPGYYLRVRVYNGAAARVQDSTFLDEAEWDAPRIMPSGPKYRRCCRECRPMQDAR